MFFDWKDFGTFLVSLALSAALIWGLVWFVRAWWSSLPLWLVLIICILLAVAVIGAPIWALFRWAERYLERQQAAARRDRRG
ncbi:MAG TPA: hypothetical protein VNN09_12605 [Candidatus Competibacteraceae bacterium]|nr:hypothetical protein [Candidatus Competibacteraceae bacterium]